MTSRAWLEHVKRSTLLIHPTQGQGQKGAGNGSHGIFSILANKPLQIPGACMTQKIHARRKWLSRDVHNRVIFKIKLMRTGSDVEAVQPHGSTNFRLYREGVG